MNTNFSKLSRRHALRNSMALAGGAALLGRQRALAQAIPATQPTTASSVDVNGKPYSETHWDEPGQPGRDYTPVITPNGWTLPFQIVGGVKVFHLVAEEVNHQFAPGLEADCWGYNGIVHGPTIEAVEGDRIRIYVTNRLAAPTSVHWHGIFLPNGMDGVSGLNQHAIGPGETFIYEFTLRQHGTHFYHSHHDEMTQMGMGMMGMFIIHPRRPASPRPDRDFALMLSEWRIDPGTRRPNPMEMTDFNVLTFNAKAFPGTAPLAAKLGDRVRMRFANGSAMDHHPIHLHGYSFWLTETDGGQIPASARLPQTTVLVPVGATRTIEFTADEPGDWAMHCHMTHHTMNQMGHNAPNTLGVDAQKLDERLRPLLPAYMTMGNQGAGEMAQHIEMGHMRVPPNSIPMIGGKGPFDYISMGGMFTIFKVRADLSASDQSDPGWFSYPAGSVARILSAQELKSAGLAADGSSAPRAPAAARAASNPVHPPTVKPGVSSAQSADAGDAVYTCRHHPEIVSDTPGKCPKCGMTLVLKR